MLAAIPLQQLRQQPDDGGGRDPEGHPPAPQLAQAAEHLAGPLDLGEDAPGVRQQRLAGLGQADAARAPMKQPQANLALQGGDLLADGWLDEMERLGGARHASKLGDALEARQLA